MMNAKMEYHVGIEMSSPLEASFAYDTAKNGWNEEIMGVLFPENRHMCEILT